MKRDLTQFAGLMLALYLSIALAGCLPPKEDKPAPAPDDNKPAPADVSAVERAASKFDTDFVAAWAVEADETARKAKAGDYKSWDEAFGDWEIRNKAAFNRLVPELAKVIDEATGRDDKFDPAKLESVLRDVASGHRSFGAK